MKVKGLKYKIEKSFFGKTQIDYLGFWVTRKGVKLIDKNTTNKQYGPADLSKEST